MARARVYTACVDCLKDPRLYERAREILPPQRRESADRMKVESGKRLSAGGGTSWSFATMWAPVPASC